MINITVYPNNATSKAETPVTQEWQLMQTLFPFVTIPLVVIKQEFLKPEEIDNSLSMGLK